MILQAGIVHPGYRWMALEISGHDQDIFRMPFLSESQGLRSLEGKERVEWAQACS
jgi:hypothetical protein